MKKNPILKVKEYNLAHFKKRLEEVEVEINKLLQDRHRLRFKIFEKSEEIKQLEKFLEK